jgi:hypothetical protein
MQSNKSKRSKQRLARLIAFYLPQFHPIPENDEWWGKGFTEWKNVAKAKPLFRGHYQPHIPADLGFYDLRVPETRIAQADMAREYGIEAFCYYHYWFAGRRILERPFNEVLASGQPDFPFCLCWANQTWSGIWHGNPGKILIEQTYPGMADHQAHFYSLLPAFTDTRYLTVDGKPVFLIYDPREIPDLERVIGYWRELALKEGLKGLHLIGMDKDPTWFQGHNLDGFIWRYLPRVDITWYSWRQPIQKFKLFYRNWMGRPVTYSYANVLLDLIKEARPEVKSYPCLLPNWDNTPRSGKNGLVLKDSTPELWRIQAQRALEMTEGIDFEERLIFVKAWNEWAEGNYLEPDLKFGKGYLEVIKEVFCR